VILTLERGIGKGDLMTFAEVVTYIILPLFAAVGAIWGTIKFIIPKATETVLKKIEKTTDAEIESQRDTREYKQKMEQLEQSFLLSGASVAQQRMADLLEDSQSTLKTIYFDGIDKIKTDTRHIPILISETKALQSQVNSLESRLRLLIGLITNDLTVGEGQPIEDYDTYQRNQAPRPSQGEP
jgi:hypothetical protein